MNRCRWLYSAVAAALLFALALPGHFASLRTAAADEGNEPGTGPRYVRTPVIDAADFNVGNSPPLTPEYAPATQQAVVAHRSPPIEDDTPIPITTHRYWATEPTSGTIFQMNGERLVLPGADDQVRVIVQISGIPLAIMMRQVPNSSQQSPAATTTAFQAYHSALQTAHQEVLRAFDRQGIQVRVNYEYTYLFNALALTITYQDWDMLANTPGVVAVYPDYQARIALDESVPLIGAPTVWQLTAPDSRNVTGQGIRVAIIDTGVDYTHPDLGGCLGVGCRVLGGYNFVEDTADPMDDNGHGTHVAGILAANGALHGVAPDAQLLAYKVCDAGGSCHQSAIIAGLEAAADPDGNPLTADAVEVANLSLGGPGDPADPLSQTVDNAAAIGIVVAVAAGNSGPGYESIGSPGVARSAAIPGGRVVV